MSKQITGMWIFLKQFHTFVKTVVPHEWCINLDNNSEMIKKWLSLNGILGNM